MNNNKPKSKKADLIVQDVNNETLVYNLKTNQAFCLNQTSGLVWQYCDGKNSIADISNLVSQKLRIIASEDFVLLAINELNKSNLLESDSQFEKYFAGFNRREIIKRVGLASMIALPIISAVVAPTSANAASCVITGNDVFFVTPQLCSDCCGDCLAALPIVVTNSCCSGTADPGVIAANTGCLPTQITVCTAKCQ